MAEEFRMGMAGAFFGAGQALAEIGREKTAETGVAYNLYIKLSQDPKFKKVGDWEYKRGMTRSQVMQGFEEAPEEERADRQFAFNDPIPEEQRPFYESVYPGLKDLGDIPLTIGMMQTLGTMSKKEATRSLEELRQTGRETLLETKQKDRMTMFDLKNAAKNEESAIKYTKWLAGLDPEELQRAMSDERRPLLQKIVNKAGFTLGKDSKRKWFIFKKDVTTFVPKPKITAPIEAKPLSKEEKMRRIQNIMKDSTLDKMEKQKLLLELAPESKNEINKALGIQEAGTQQITTPGITETGTAGIGRDLRRPSLAQPGITPAPGVGVPTQGAGTPAPGLTRPDASLSSFMPNASPYNRLKTLAYLRNIPRQR